MIYAMAMLNLENLPTQTLYKLASAIYGYVQVPPTIDEFIESPEYLGSVLDYGKAVYPVWREALRLIYPNPFYSPYVEVIATGAIGIGKTTLAKIGVAYDIAKLLLLASPQTTYRLLPTTSIVYMLFASTLDLAHAVILNELMDWFQTSPFFRQFLSKSDKNHIFTKRITIEVGSRARHALGKAVFGAVLDEANFGIITNQVYENYTNTKRRMQSRFMKDGHLPGHLWLLSSKKSDLDFLQVHIENVKNDPSTVIFDYPIWKVKPDMVKSNKTFKVFTGDDLRDPFIIDDESVIKQLNLDPRRIIEVPEDFRREFEMDLHNALRDLAGVYVRAGVKFFYSLAGLRQAQRVPNFITAEPIRYVGQNLRLIDFLSPDFKDFIESTRAKPRYIHIDLALRNDRVGISMSHVMGYVSNNAIYEPIHFVDFVMYIEPAVGEFKISLVKEFILDLYTQYRVFIDCISADQFQSAMLLQELASLGFRTKRLSVDSTYDPYAYLRRCISEKRILLPQSKLLFTELSELVDTGSKVDHPPGLSKDGADAVAGSVWLARENSLSPSNKFATVSVTPQRYNAFVLTNELKQKEG